MGNNQSNTDMHEACQEGSLDHVEAMLGKDQTLANLKGSMGRTPLHYAASHGYKEIVALLLRKGASLEEKDDDGWTALMGASIWGHTEVVAMLLEQGATANAQDTDGVTALMMASVEGHQDVVSLLLASGATVDVTNKDGSTALMWASWQGKKDVVNMLLKGGADIRAENEDGETALKGAVDLGHQEVVTLLQEKAVKSKRSEGVNALIKACTETPKDMVAKLIERGASAKAQLEKDASAFFSARDKDSSKKNVEATTLDETPKFFDQSPPETPTANSEQMFPAERSNQEECNDAGQNGNQTGEMTEECHNDIMSILPGLFQKGGFADCINMRSSKNEPSLSGGFADCINMRSSKNEPSLSASIANMNKKRLSVLEGVLKGFLRDIEKTKEDRRNAEELCCICLDRAKSTVLLPCKHLCVCARCSQEPSLTKCPICCVPIQEKMIIFS